MSSSPNDTNPEPSEMESLTSRLSALNRALDGPEEPAGEDTMTQWDGPPPDELGPDAPEEAAEDFASLTEEPAPPPIPELPAPLAEPVEEEGYVATVDMLREWWNREAARVLPSSSVRRSRED